MYQHLGLLLSKTPKSTKTKNGIHTNANEPTPKGSRSYRPERRHACLSARTARIPSSLWSRSSHAKARQSSSNPGAGAVVLKHDANAGTSRGDVAEANAA